jgi:protein-tyrosine phosphatase
MTTNIRETGTMKCFPYWPTECKEITNVGLYQIQNEKSEKFDSFIVTILTLRKKNNPETRIIYHAHYLKWPDHGIPTNTKDALLFLEKVEYYRQITITKAPILLHCSAGIGRTGTFCAIDIGIKKYLEKKFIDIPSTVVKMRTERAGSVQTEDQYLFAYLALMDFIKQQQALQERINQSNKTTEIHISNEIDDNIYKTSRTKTNGKKSNDFEYTNILPTTNSGKIPNLQEVTSHRGKTLSDSSVSAVQYITPSTTTVPQTEPSRQRSSIDHISSTPTTTGNVHHKKARK